MKPYSQTSLSTGAAIGASLLIALLAAPPPVHGQAAAPAAAGQPGSTQTPMPAVAKEPPPYTLDSRGTHAPAKDFDHLRDIASRQGAVRAIVGLQILFTPEGALDRIRSQQQRDSIASAAVKVIASLGGNRYSLLRTYTSVPAVALSLSVPALDALRACGNHRSLHRVYQEARLRMAEVGETLPEHWGDFLAARTS